MDSSMPSQGPPVNNETKRGPDQQNENDKVVSTYLKQKSAVFRELYELRKEVWANDIITEDYKKRELENRNPTEEQKEEMDKKNFRTCMEFLAELGGRWPGDARLLDLCFAPGGFSKAFLESGGKYSRGFTLPVQRGGLEKSYENHDFYTTALDINLLANQFGLKASDLKQIDPLKRHWDDTRPFENVRKFTLVLCDGHVMRQLKGESEDQHQLKISRLLISQLILALQGVDQEHGMIVIRLYTADKWQTVKIIHQFSKFVDKEDMVLFKSDRNYRSSSVVYLIVKKLKPGKILDETVEDWKKDWYQTMLGGDGKGEMLALDKEDDVKKVLEEIGGWLIKLSTRSWEIQREGLTWKLKKAEKEALRRAEAAEK